MRHETGSIFSISSLFLAIGFLALGYGLILTYVALGLQAMAIPNSIIGLINGGFFLGAMAAAVFAQKIISSYGHIRSYSFFAAGMIMAFLLHGMFADPILWAVLRLLSGFFLYGLFIILESWLNEKSTQAMRGRILAVYTLVFYLATALGQLFINLEARGSSFLFSLGSLFVLVSLIIISVIRIREPDLQPFARYSIPKIFQLAPLALTGSITAGFFVGGFFTMLPLVIMARYQSIEILSWFMTITILGGLIAQWPVGHLSDTIGRRKMMSFCGFTTGVIGLFFLILPTISIIDLVLGSLLGIGIFCLYPLAVARANDVIDVHRDIVEISRTLLFAYGLGSFFAPLLLGYAMNLGEDLVFGSFALLGLLLGGFALTQDRVPQDQLSTFVNVPIAFGPVATEFDPRVDE
jgi:MFS family permease